MLHLLMRPATLTTPSATASRDKYGRDVRSDVTQPVKAALLARKADVEERSGATVRLVALVQGTTTPPTAASRLTVDGTTYAVTAHPTWVSHPLAPALGHCWRLHIEEAPQ